MREKNLKLQLIFAISCLTSIHAYALPIGFGYNQGKLEFSEITSPDFMERWFQNTRTSPLIVNMSAESDNASFANFITDSIELQTLGQGTRDLAWHEYTHATMYQRLDNFFGPAGSILHLPWMEAWFLEGLAEAISVSVGSEQQAGVERHQALQDDWPTWDRIHSLYTSGPFSYRGYATSGAFVAWIMRTYDANRLPEILTKFRDDTMPWWWPWAMTPFNQFWPMDTMLREWTGHSGKELYELYKTAATIYWKSQSPMPLHQSMKDPHLAIASSSSIQMKNNKLFALTEIDRKMYLRSIEFKDATSAASQWGGEQTEIGSVRDVWASSVAVDGNARAFVTDHWPRANERRAAVVYIDGHKRRTIKRKANWISQVFLSKENIWWLEYELESTRVCSYKRVPQKNSKISCVLTHKTPTALSFLGIKDDAGGKPIVLSLAATTQTMLGDRHQVIEVQLDTGTVTNHPWTAGGKPLSLAHTKAGTWILVSDRSRRYIRQYNNAGQCLRSTSISDMPLRLTNSTQDYPSSVVWMGENVTIIPLAEKDFTNTSCLPLDDHTSPLLFAMRSGSYPDLKTAMNGASIWQNFIVDNSKLKTDPALTALDASSSTDGITKDTELAETKARWRGRPVFAFPWIGADDALGPQLGIISVPLMDHQQNETVRATILLGLFSRFPYQELALIENRFTPTWTIAPYRSQTYNGRYLDKETDQIFSSYLDEKGVHVDGDLAQSWKDFSIVWNWGARGGHLAKYLGESSHVGNYKEVYGAVSTGWHFADRWRLLASTQSRVAPKSINQKFEYNVVGASTSIVRTIGDGSIDLGIEAERTRGSYRRDLQEMYMPLKTFLPGTGGGYNKNSYPITSDYGLFSPLFGDSQARTKLNVTHPLISDFDKFYGLIYIDRLDFSAFLNHGTAWNGDKLPEKSRFLTAHGYNVDLLMDNKGVRFNCGLGIGQVIGQKWQSYATAGFDAFF